MMAKWTSHLRSPAWFLGAACGMAAALAAAAWLMRPDMSTRPADYAPAEVQAARRGRQVHIDPNRPPALYRAVDYSQGRRAAEAIDRKFLGRERQTAEMPVIRADRMRLDHYEKLERTVAVASSRQVGWGSPHQSGDIDSGGASPTLPAADQVMTESKRCMSCGYCFDCEKCWMFCTQQGIVKPAQKGALYSFKLENCTGCKKCSEECPCGFIDMQ